MFVLITLFLHNIHGFTFTRCQETVHKYIGSFKVYMYRLSAEPKGSGSKQNPFVRAD